MMRSACWMLALLLSGVSPWLAAQAPAPDETVLPPAALARADGEPIFRHICQGCHMPDAHGASGAGSYPALAGDPRLASARYAAAIILHGRRNMPAFGPRPDLQGFDAMMHVDLSDAQIAAVVNFIRSHFGNRYADGLSAADVAALHLATAPKP
jgi:mono/diheme cytochrome c family protein